MTEEQTFITYQMADGDLIYGEYSYVTDLEYFEDRDEEIRLIKKTYQLLSTEEIVLPDPYPIIDDDEDDTEEPVSDTREDI